MSEPRDEQELAEALDADEIDPGQVPPDRPMGLPDLVRADAKTAGQQAEDSVADRAAREEPEQGGRGPSEPPVELLAVDDRESGTPDGQMAGAVAEPDHERDVSRLSDSSDSGEVPPAEEAAIHIEEG
jgi:hypothetical protein